LGDIDKGRSPGLGHVKLPNASASLIDLERTFWFSCHVEGSIALIIATNKKTKRRRNEEEKGDDAIF